MDENTDAGSADKNDTEAGVAGDDTEAGDDEDNDGLERHPHAGEMPSDPGVQAERQEAGMEAEWEHE